MTDHKEPKHDIRSDTAEKKRYERPRVLSVEKLEVVASTCSDGVQFAKSDPISCAGGPNQS